MKAKLKDGRTGTIINKDGKIANFLVDQTSTEAAGTIQVLLEDIIEESSGAGLKAVPPTEAVADPVAEKKETPGMMEVAGSAALLKPVFVAAIIEAMKSPELSGMLLDELIKRFSDKKTVSGFIKKFTSVMETFKEVLNELDNEEDLAQQQKQSPPPAPKKAAKKKAAKKK